MKRYASKERAGTSCVSSLFAALLLCVLVLGLCGCAQEASDSNALPEYKTELLDEHSLKVLIAPDYPPFAAGTAEEAWGYDIAVAQEIASRLGLALEFVPATRDQLVSVLACETPADTSEQPTPEPQADIAIAALAITPERDDHIDFSSWYYVGNQAVVTRTGVYESTIEFDREKTRIAVVKGSTCLETAKTITDEKLVAEYSTAQRCLQALQAKEVQAAVLDLPVATYLTEHEFTDLCILERIMTGEAYGIAIPTQSGHLKDAINEALAEMEEDGTLARLEEEYVKHSY